MLLVYLYGNSDDSGESVNTLMVKKGYAWLTTLNEAVENSDPEALELIQEERGTLL